MSDRRCKAELEVKVNDGLKKLDKCGATGYMKLWALHHILLPQVRWYLMVYEIPVSCIEGVERFFCPEVSWCESESHQYSSLFQEGSLPPFFPKSRPLIQVDQVELLSTTCWLCPQGNS